MFLETILRKRLWRSDALWTNAFSHTLLRRIPFHLDAYALSRSQYWPHPQMKCLQDARIDALLARAQKIPFWLSLFAEKGLDLREVRGREVLRSLPVTSKRDFRDADVSTYTDGALLRTSEKDKTSGSTGTPFYFFHDRGYELRSFAICDRFFRDFGRGVRHPLVSMRAHERMGFALYNYHFFFIGSSASIRHRFTALLELLKSLRCKAILFSFTSMVIELAHVAKDQGVELPLQGIIAAGEHLSSEHREAVEHMLGVEVRTHYAMGELGRLAFECGQHILHINEEWAYVEIVDGEGHSVPDGSEGRIVVTVFDNTVMPFIRYDTGDRGVISADPCPCGRTLRTLRLQGRDMHIIAFPDGRTISLLGISGVLNARLDSIRQYQFVRTGEYDFTVRVVPRGGFDRVKDDIRDSLVRYAHPRLNVTWEETDTIESGATGKIPYFIDARSS